MSCAIRLIIAILLFLFTPVQDARQTITSLVARIQRADFEDDRATLARVSAELAPFVENSALASRVHYWRGFALWRRALNAQNEPTPPRIRNCRPPPSVRATSTPGNFPAKRSSIFFPSAFTFRIVSWMPAAATAPGSVCVAAPDAQANRVGNTVTIVATKARA